jgi:presenilin-like A22 family membrane protease
MLLLLWSFCAVIIGIGISPFIASKLPNIEASPIVITSVFIGLLLVSAVMWWFFMKKFEPATIDVIFSAGIALALGDLTMQIIRHTINLPLIVLILLGGLLPMLFYLAYFNLVKKMQTSWEWTKRLTWVSNVFIILVLGFAGAAIGSKLSPWVMMGILFLAAIYDAWAVWKSGTMQKMATYFIDRRIIPGLAVPKQEEGKFALIGGGDILFIIAVAASFFKTSLPMVFISAAWMFGAVVYLFVASRKEKFYPALPFIFAGLFCAYITGVALTAVHLL